MSLQASVGFQIPTNVVEVGNEITADQLAAINAASNAPTAGNPFATNAFVTGQGYITSAPYDTQKAIVNLCASCFTSIGTNFYFTNYVAQCVAQGSKFTSGSQYLLGIGTSGSAPTYTFALTSSSANVADTGVGYTSVSGQCVCYSDNYGSSWTYSDLSF